MLLCFELILIMDMLQLIIFFISGNFYFSIVIFIIVQYITTPKNNEKIKINWDKKLTTIQYNTMFFILRA